MLRTVKIEESFSIVGFGFRLKTSEIEKAVNNRTILSTLKQRPAEFHSRMFKYVYPGLNGTEHNQLIYFYALLQGCGEDDPITPDTHLKLLKKIKTAAGGEVNKVF